MINLTPLTPDTPFAVSEEEYEKLVKRKEGGWSNCGTLTEWLCKLHYLRRGLGEQKITREEFAKREQELVIRWCYRFTSDK